LKELKNVVFADEQGVSDAPEPITMKNIHIQFENIS